MTTDELNTALVMEITHYRQTDELTLDLKRLLMELIWLESPKSRYAHIPDNVKILCEADAYIAACKHCIHFDPKKTDNTESIYKKMLKSSVVILNDKVIKNRYGNEYAKEERVTTAEIRDAEIVSWDKNTKTLYLKTKD